MNRGKSLKQQQEEWGLDLTGPEPVPMTVGETGDAGAPVPPSVPPFGQWGIDLTGAEPRPMAVEESQWGVDLTGPEPRPMMDYETPEAPPPREAGVDRTPPTASTRATRGSIVDQLAAPITQNEKAVLEDPRASGSAEAARRMSGDVRNIMLSLAGLPTVPIGESPFVSERDKLRQFVMQRGGVAERQAAGEEGRDIRREQLAAAEAARLRSEKAAALARGDADAAREADRKLRERGLELEAARGEREERRLKLSEKAAAAPKLQKTPEGFDADEIKFGKETLRATFPANMPKELKLHVAKQARESAGKWDTVVAAQDQLEEALSRFAASPSLANKQLLKGPALAAAAATNAGLGQGAMSDAEKRAQYEALGINMGEPDQLINAIESAFGSKEAAEAMLGRVRQMKRLARSTVEAQTRGAGYSFTGATQAATAAEKSGDMVTVRHKPSGKTKTINRQAAEKYLSSSDFEEVK